MSFYNEIIHGIYLGSVEASENIEFIKEKNISVIVNCSKDIKDTFSLNLLKNIEDAPTEIQEWLYNNSYYIKYHRIPINDSGRNEDIEKFYQYTIQLLPIIKKEYCMGKNILIHCLAGVQRSASFTVALLMYYYKKPLNEMISYVINKKANVFFFGKTNNFIDALIKVEKYIKDHNYNIENDDTYNDTYNNIRPIYMI
jgi:protein-tyrosine phosphatase